ncbi:MAG: cytochrome b561 domain-containing protein [Lautropia sp.]
MSPNELVHWLTAPIRVGPAVPLDAAAWWHALAMAVATGIAAPLAVLLARYWKVVPRQDWPRVLDHPFWWGAHRWLAAVTLAGVAVGCALVFSHMNVLLHLSETHGWLGWLAVVMMLALVVNGLLRGSEGGPGRSERGALTHMHERPGDHYDMSARRRWFERTHKTLGYCLLLVFAAATVSGLWHANVPRWILLGFAGWWEVLLIIALVWERQGRAIDGYQAKWGPGMNHPGNRIPALGWGSRRYTEDSFRRLRWARWRPAQPAAPAMTAVNRPDDAWGPGGPPTIVMWEAIVQERTAKAAGRGPAPGHEPVPGLASGPESMPGPEGTGRTV